MSLSEIDIVEMVTDISKISISCVPDLKEASVRNRALISDLEARIGVEINSDKEMILALGVCLCTSFTNNEASKQHFRAAIDRERLGSTALGHGLAVPHVHSPIVKKPSASWIRLADFSIDYEALDDIPVDLVAFVIVPTDHHSFGNMSHDQSHIDGYFKFLEAVSRLMRDGVLRAVESEDFASVIQRAT